MGQKPPKPMTPFDALVTPHHLYMLKLLLPYTPVSAQRFLGIYIKFLEFQNTLTRFHGFSGTCPPSLHILDDLKPYMETSEMKMMEQMEDMMNMIEMMQHMQSMSEDISQTSGQNDSGFNPMDILKTMMPPEQQEMFNMYSTMFDNELNHPDEGNQKGESDHERMDQQSGDEKY